MKKTAFLLLISWSCICLAQAQTTEKNRSSKNSSWQINDNKNNIKVTIRGDAGLSDDDKRIASLSPAGSINYRVNREQLEVTLNKQGNIQYKINGELKTSLNQADDAFITTAIRSMISKGLDAKQRAQRIYAKSGLNGLLQEVERLDGDYPRSLYLKTILHNAIPQSETMAILEQTNRSLTSDFYRSEVLDKVSAKSLNNNDILDSYLKVVAGISSTYYQYTCLNRLINQTQISKEQQAKAIQLAQQMDSDYYKSELLKNMFNKQSLSATSNQEVFKLLSLMKSDYYKAEVLNKMTNLALSKEDWKLLITQVAKIGSDYYKSQVLQKIIAKAPKSEDLKKDLTEATKAIKSETYFGKTMRLIADL